MGLKAGDTRSWGLDGDSSRSAGLDWVPGSSMVLKAGDTRS